jgi:hypothetical protein
MKLTKFHETLPSVLLKVDCKISVLLGLIQNFEVFKLGDGKVNKVNIAVA